MLKLCRIFLILLLLTTAAGCHKQEEEEATESSSAALFAADYPDVKGRNVFVPRSKNDIEKILESGTGIIFLATPNDEWSQRYAVFLNNTALDEGIKRINYFDISEERNKNSSFYKKLVKLIGDCSLVKEDSGERVLLEPVVLFVDSGNIVDYENTAAIYKKDGGNIDEFFGLNNLEQLKKVLIIGFGCLDNRKCSTSC